MYCCIIFLYRFNWTDGKLNSSNLIELSGQITEKFDEEFRILYAQSLPLNTRGSSIVRNSGVFEHLLLKHLVTPSPRLVREKPTEPVCLTSTPTRKPKTLAVHSPCVPLTLDCRKTTPVSDSSTIEEDWTEQQHKQEEILAGNTAHCFPVTQLTEGEPPCTVSCHVSTQTCQSLTDSDTQTNVQLTQRATDITPNIMGPNRATSPSLVPAQQILPTRAPPDSTIKDYQRLTKERQHQYSIIRSKLERMVTSLSHRRELADITNMTERLNTHSRQRVYEDFGLDANPRVLVE